MKDKYKTLATLFHINPKIKTFHFGIKRLFAFTANSNCQLLQMMICFYSINKLTINRIIKFLFLGSLSASSNANASKVLSLILYGIC
jgi:hypothetical protein